MWYFKTKGYNCKANFLVFLSLYNFKAFVASQVRSPTFFESEDWFCCSESCEYGNINSGEDLGTDTLTYVFCDGTVEKLKVSFN